MMRVYLPVAVDVLARWLSSGSVAAPVTGFAVAATGPSGAVEPGGAEVDDTDTEAAEYAAFSAAVAELGSAQPRLVVSVDCPDAEVTPLGPETGRVRLTSPIAWSAVAAVHADDPDAAEPDPLGHLLWFAATEVDDLLARFGTDATNG